jgi:hypothetical protein
MGAGKSIEYAFVVRSSRVRRYVMAEIAKELAVMDQWEEGRYVVVAFVVTS